MNGCPIAEQWHTTLSPPMILRENRDVGHGGTVAPIAVSSGRQCGRMRCFTPTSAFLFVNLLGAFASHGPSCRMATRSVRTRLLRFAFYPTVAVRVLSDSRPPRRAAPVLTGYSVTFQPGSIPHRGPGSDRSNRRAAVCTGISFPSPGRRTAARGSTGAPFPEDELRPASSR